MARVFVAEKEGRVRWDELVQGKALGFEEIVEDDGYWSLRALLDFKDVDAVVLIVQQGEGLYSGCLARISVGLYDAFFGWVGKSITYDPMRVSNYDEMLAYLDREVKSLKAHLHWSYEQAPPRPTTYGGIFVPDATV